MHLRERMAPVGEWPSNRIWWPLAAALLVAACSGTVGTSVPSEGGGDGVSITESFYPPAVECMVEAGATVTEVDGGYEFDMAGVDDPTSVGRECGKLWQPAEKSDAELRETYDRWVEEAVCLRGLGFDPEPAPSFETFVADWRSDGPWMPIDGVNVSSWSADTYQEVKAVCELEMYARG